MPPLIRAGSVDAVRVVRRCRGAARRAGVGKRARFYHDFVEYHVGASWGIPTRRGRETHALIGTPDEIAVKLEALRWVGVDHVLLSGQGSRDNFRRFARDIMLAFAGV
jgi:alkanesulfonate monooxygenase SsuD/methylene tetrahydromethanopterin reductase-like flavin-dependent oxidoreductase (luciferase family)